MTSDGRFATANFFRPSQYFINLHLNSLPIRFFRSYTEKIAVANQTSDVATRTHVNSQTKMRRLGNFSVTHRTYDIISRIHVYVH